LQPAAATPPASARIPSRSRLRLASAWGVHALTASGAVLVTLALIALSRGAVEHAGLLMLGALAIDSVDGTLARRIGVAELVPHIDGRRLDDIVDFLSYAIVPVFFLVWIGALPPVLAAAPVLASAYGFSQYDAKTEDDFFLGWPSYWNVVALYVWLLEIGPAGTSAWVLFFTAAVFVPLKYVYPSKLRRFRRSTVIGAVIWLLAMALAVSQPERARAWRLPELSLLFPVWYVALSAWLGRWWRWGA
jgi:phosphatidylcholine synthase